MDGLMQDRQLSLPMLVERIESIFGHKKVVTRQVGFAMESTYADLALRIRTAAAVLDRLGVPAHARVGTFAWNTQRHLELYMAIPSSGRVIHTINHRLFEDQLEYIIDDAGDDVIFVDRSILPSVWDVIRLRPSVRHVVVMDDGDPAPLPLDDRLVDYESLMARTSPFEGDFEEVSEASAAALCYTSGTTGNPKGVLYDHRSIILHALMLLSADSFGLRNCDVILPVVPMFHVNAWGLPFAALMCGADLVMPGTATGPEEIAGLLSEHRVTFAAAVATVWRGVAPFLKERGAPGLRMLVCGGGAVPASLSLTYLDMVGLPLRNAWGMTETSPVVTGARQDHPEDRTVSRAERIEQMSSPGIALPLTRMRLVGTAGESIPHDGQSRGELQVSGPTIARGYFGSETGEDAFTDDGWLRTGDVATIDYYGNLRIVDRTKDLIKSGGEWISSVELENEIMSDPRILEAAVVAIPDERWGERPLACVVPAEGECIDGSDIRQFLLERVAKWWVPDEVIVMRELPKTATGKFSKVALRSRVAGAIATEA